MNSNAEPQLAPPGAGLPAVELRIARLLFALKFHLGNRKSFTARFQLERERVRALANSCDTKSAATRVLIARPPGLEDSSRYWSVWMTLDHLRIVNSGILQTIRSLTRGVVPPGQASTAAVKPNPEAGPEVLADFEHSCDALLKVVASSPSLNTPARFAHPWFGPLNAAGWHALAASHTAIHRVQL